MSVSATALAFILVTTVHASILPSVVASRAGKKRQATTQIQKAVLAHLVPDRCAIRDCALAIDRTGIRQEWLAELAEKGRVVPLQEGDFAVLEGSTQAFRRNETLILSVGKVRLKSVVDAEVEVIEFSSRLLTRRCKHRLVRTERVWTVRVSESLCASSF